MTARNVLEFDATYRAGDFVLEAAFTAGLGVTALFGPSGAGKTTVINLIAGLARPDKGRIALFGDILCEAPDGRFVPKHQRRIGLVYQDAQLFPHLTVRQNLNFGRWFAPKDAHRIDFDLVIEKLGIAGIVDRRPTRLSGGERQRVALARALLSSPRLLLMDEPLAGLDQDRKSEILTLIEHIRDAYEIPIIYVSHAADEVRRLARHVVMLEKGRVASAGSANSVKLA